MSILGFKRPFPVLPELIVDPTAGGPATGTASVSVRDSGTFLAMYHTGSGITFLHRISKAKDLDLQEVPKLDPATVAQTQRKLLAIGAIMCVPVFTAIIGLPMILLGLLWPSIVGSAGVLRT